MTDPIRGTVGPALERFKRLEPIGAPRNTTPPAAEYAKKMLLSYLSEAGAAVDAEDLRKLDLMLVQVAGWRRLLG